VTQCITSVASILDCRQFTDVNISHSLPNSDITKVRFIRDQWDVIGVTV